MKNAVAISQNMVEPFRMNAEKLESTFLLRLRRCGHMRTEKVTWTEYRIGLIRYYGRAEAQRRTDQDPPGDQGFASVVRERQSIPFPVYEGRQAFMVRIEGEAGADWIDVHIKDALEIAEQDIEIRATHECHVIVLEMENE
jgi:hypothetical protein